MFAISVKMTITWITVKTVQQSKFLFQKKLYYGCHMPVSTDYNLRSCKQRRVCDTCGEKHPTGLHGYKDSKKKKMHLVATHRRVIAL